jgi:pyruvate/2-oxoglutarate dehydrogenase complex dihydrolipoamide acyltransferase (E2) component
MSNPFELHALRAGKWKIDSVMDDKELAVEAARALARRNGVEAVRVVREMYNDKKGEFARRTIFHTSRQQETISAESDRRKQAEADGVRNAHAASRLGQAGKKQVEELRRRAARLRMYTMLGASTAAVVLVIVGWMYLKRMI